MEGRSEVGVKVEDFWVVSGCVCWVVMWGLESRCLHAGLEGGMQEFGELGVGCVLGRKF